MSVAHLFAKSGTFQSYTMFSVSHLLLFALSLLGIALSLFFSRRMDRIAVHRTIRRLTLLLWGLELVKILFNLLIGNADNPNTYVPLYFCSLPLYCGLFAAYAKGWLKRLGEVFLLVGGAVGGIVYLISPSTTAGTYPAFHFITLQSFLLHSIMVYLSLLIIRTNYIRLHAKDFPLYALTVASASLLAYVLNAFLGSNLMFVSRNFPGTAVAWVYHVSPTLFPLLMTLIQAMLPFFAVYGILNGLDRWRTRRKKCRSDV